MKHKDQPKELLTEEMVELLTVPADLATYKAAITEALYKSHCFPLPLVYESE